MLDQSRVVSASFRWGPEHNDVHWFLSCGAARDRWNSRPRLWSKPCDDSQTLILARFDRALSIGSGNLQITLIKSAFCEGAVMALPREITRQPQVHISVTSVFFYCKYSNLSARIYIPARRKMSVHPRWHRKQKRIELPKESKLPSSTQHHLVKKK